MDRRAGAAQAVCCNAAVDAALLLRVAVQAQNAGTQSLWGSGEFDAAQPPTLDPGRPDGSESSLLVRIEMTKT